MRKRFLLAPVLVVASGFCVVGARAHKAEWSSMERYFLEASTFPDDQWRADDFGQVTRLADQALLTRFKPRVVIGPEGLPPVDFYRDYLPQAVVLGPWRKVVQAAPSREFLKRIERDRRYHLDFRGSAPCRGAGCISFRGALYGRVFRETMGAPDGVSADPVSVVILKYTAVFMASGLPMGVTGARALGARIAGDLDNWHELDIHGAIQLLFLEGEAKPFVVLLAQHNHFRTYVVGKDIDWPESGRLRVCFAQRSNEPYPCPTGSEPARHRAVGNPTKVRYLFLGGREPLLGADDVVFGEGSGGVELGVDMRFLPSRDPFYVSWIPLGDRQRLLGVFKSWARKGPPGVDMNSFPTLRKYTDIAQFWYVKDGDEKAVEVFESSIKGLLDVDVGAVRAFNGRALWRDLGWHQAM